MTLMRTLDLQRGHRASEMISSAELFTWFAAGNVLPTAMEESLIFDGATLHSWFRDTGAGGIFRAYSSDTRLVQWTRGSQIATGELPYVKKVGDYYYMMKQDGDYSIYLYSSPDRDTWTIRNGGSPVATHGGPSDWNKYFFNPSFEVIDGVWHMVIEGAKDGALESFKLAYSYAVPGGTAPVLTLDFDAHMSGPLMSSSGNPDLHHVEDRSALLLVYSTSGTITARTAALADNLAAGASWKASNFVLSKSGITLSDPSLAFTNHPDHPFRCVLAYNHNQLDGRRAYGSCDLTLFYDLVASGRTFAYVAP